MFLFALWRLTFGIYESAFHLINGSSLMLKLLEFSNAEQERSLILFNNLIYWRIQWLHASSLLQEIHRHFLRVLFFLV
jgi:hypothetical protein